MSLLDTLRSWLGIDQVDDDHDRDMKAEPPARMDDEPTGRRSDEPVGHEESDENDGLDVSSEDENTGGRIVGDDDRSVDDDGNAIAGRSEDGSVGDDGSGLDSENVTRTVADDTGPDPVEQLRNLDTDSERDGKEP